MLKYKIGDKIKVISEEWDHVYPGVFNNIGVIICIRKDKYTLYGVKFSKKICGHCLGGALKLDSQEGLWLKESMIKLIELKSFPIVDWCKKYYK